VSIVAVIGPVRRYWWVGLLAIIAALSLKLASRTAALSDMAALRMAERRAHEITQSNYRETLATARAADAEHARAVETAQQEVTNAVSSDYQSRVAAVRARYDSLLRDVRVEAAAGGRGSTAVPGVPVAASGPDAASAQAGLPAGDALIATEQAFQLEALQSWVRGQGAVSR